MLFLTADNLLLMTYRNTLRQSGVCAKRDIQAGMIGSLNLVPGLLSHGSPVN